MRKILLYIFALLLIAILSNSYSFGQGANWKAIAVDTIWTATSVKIGGALRIPLLSTPDATKFLRINSQGYLELGTPSGDGDVTTSQLADSMQVVRDSLAAIRGDIVGGGDVTTSQLNDSMVVIRDSLVDHWTAIMGKQASLGYTPENVANKVTSFASPDNTTYPTTAAVNSLVGSYKLKSDSTATSGYVTHYQDDTGKQNIRNEIAVVIDTTEAHNTRLLTWEQSAAFGISASNIANWDNAYSNRITSLTTTGSSGAATLISNVLNIPDYSGSLSGYVPYTGATANVDLGTYNLTTPRVHLDTVDARSSMGVHIHSNNHTGIMTLGAGGGSNITFDGYPTTTPGDSVLTTNSSGALLRYDLKTKLSTYLQLSDTVNNVSTRSWRQKAVDSLNLLIAAKGSGTVTSVATNTGTGITGGTITGSGTVAADTFLLGTKAWRQKGIDSVTAIGYITPSSTNTLTNKRWTARVTSQTTVSATPSINTDNQDIWKVTAQTVDITSMTTNLTGTPVDGDILEIQITGTAARAITWGTSFVSSTVTLPTTTTTTATLTVVLQYYTTSSYGNNKWVCANTF